MVSLEQSMRETVFIVSRLMEAVHVQLSHERRVIAVFEILRQHFRS